GFARDTVEPFGEVEIVYGMHGVEEFDRAPRLVRLQMSDQMPLNFSLVAEGLELGNLDGGLLDAAFAESVNARFNSLADSSHVDGLADGDERDFRSLAAGALARRSYTPIDRFQPRPQILRHYWRHSWRPSWRLPEIISCP